MSKRSRSRRPVKAARKVKRVVRAAKRRPGRAKPPKRSPRIGAPATLVSTEWLAAQLALARHLAKNNATFYGAFW